MFNLKSGDLANDVLCLYLLVDFGIFLDIMVKGQGSQLQIEYLTLAH